MTDMGWLTAIVGAHIGHSVALAAVLACSLIFARKMSGSGRYALCGFALLAALVLPAVALTPGGSMMNRILGAIDAPIAFSGSTQEAAAAQPASPSLTIHATVSGAEDGSVRFAGAADLALPSPASPQSLRETTPAPTIFDPGAIDRAGAVAPAPQTPEWLQGLFDKAASLVAGIPDLTLFLFCAWLVGSLILLAKAGSDLLASQRMVRNSQPIQLPPALARRFADVRIATSEQAPGPMAAGVVNPTILLPIGFETELERPGMVALLEHERAHVERRDMLVALGQRIALALLWWSPAMHWISRRMDEEREVACDEIAVERTGDPRAFALTLTHQAESQLWARAPQLAVGAIGGKSQFGRRIGRLVELARGGKTADAVNSRTSGRFAFTGMALVAIAAACLTPGLAARAQDSDVQVADETERVAPRVVRIRADQTPPAPPAPPAPVSEPLTVTPLPPVAPLPPEVIDSLDELSADMESLGIEISALVTDELLDDLPDLLEEVFESIEETGVVGDEFAAEWRAELEDLRLELRTELAPEIRIQIKDELTRAQAERDRSLIRANAEARADRERALAEARREVERARAEMERELTRARVEIDRAQIEVQRALASSDAHGLSAEERAELQEEIREALEEARQEIAEARENARFDLEVEEPDGQYAPEDGRLEGGEDDGRRGPNAGDFYLEFDYDHFRNLSGPQVSPPEFEDHAGKAPRAPSPLGIGRYDCPQNG